MYNISECTKESSVMWPRFSFHQTIVTPRFADVILVLVETIKFFAFYPIYIFEFFIGNNIPEKTEELRFYAWLDLYIKLSPGAYFGRETFSGLLEGNLRFNSRHFRVNSLNSKWLCNCNECPLRGILWFSPMTSRHMPRCCHATHNTTRQLDIRRQGKT